MAGNDSINSLMGFSVHQPALGAPLQFFPDMGSKQLDDMINAYVPGEGSILDKRAAVSMEFFEHTIATGELFKFFMVYPTLGTTSPASSGFDSSFNTSPTMSDGQWTQASDSSFSSYSKKARSSGSATKKASTPTSDFSHLPGMKIMTSDGRDVTNSASRGCKTKEQRDHAHLMRIMKACEACRKKKTRCDPSHKRTVGGSSSATKVTKSTKSARPAAAPPQPAVEQSLLTSQFDQAIAESSTSFDSLFSESLKTADNTSMEWDQFINYDEEPQEYIPFDYDFFLDPAGYFSPATSTDYTSSSTSPAQPVTPVQTSSTDGVTRPDRSRLTGTTTETEAQVPTLPYLNPGGVEGGNDYVDFNLFSPGSSPRLDEEDLGLASAVDAAHQDQTSRTAVAPVSQLSSPTRPPASPPIEPPMPVVNGMLLLGTDTFANIVPTDVLQKRSTVHARVVGQFARTPVANTNLAAVSIESRLNQAVVDVTASNVPLHSDADSARLAASRDTPAHGKCSPTAPQGSVGKQSRETSSAGHEFAWCTIVLAACLLLAVLMPSASAASLPIMSVVTAYQGFQRQRAATPPGLDKPDHMSARQLLSSSYSSFLQRPLASTPGTANARSGAITRRSPGVFFAELVGLPFTFVTSAPSVAIFTAFAFVVVVRGEMYTQKKVEA
ncbi:hypothetical protein F4780DRAFT_778702 [Xylariomycetidae sp. FL0641]|nr:hypothetical protein F4780DRAFT_778702 [Xylariomycetidae sp. FL0641]